MMRLHAVGVVIDEATRSALVFYSDMYTDKDDARPLIRRAGRWARSRFGDAPRIVLAAVPLAERAEAVARLVDGLGSLPGYRVDTRYYVTKGDRRTAACPDPYYYTEEARATA